MISASVPGVRMKAILTRGKRCGQTLTVDIEVRKHRMIEDGLTLTVIEPSGKLQTIDCGDDVLKALVALLPPRDAEVAALREAVDKAEEVRAAAVAARIETESKVAGLEEERDDAQKAAETAEADLLDHTENEQQEIDDLRALLTDILAEWGAGRDPRKDGAVRAGMFRLMEASLNYESTSGVTTLLCTGTKGGAR